MLTIAFVPFSFLGGARRGVEREVLQTSPQHLARARADCTAFSFLNATT